MELDGRRVVLGGLVLLLICPLGVVAPEPPAAPPTNITFDLDKLVKADYIISKSAGEPCGYKFAPAAQRSIGQLVVDKVPVVMATAQRIIEEIIIFKGTGGMLKYVVKMKEGEGIGYLHFAGRNHLSLIEFIDEVETKLFPMGGYRYALNLKNSFDLKFNVLEVFTSMDKALTAIVITPKRGVFSTVHNGPAPLHEGPDNSVTKVTILVNNEVETLLKLELKAEVDGSKFVYFKGEGGAWVKIEKEEYDRLFSENNFTSATTRSFDELDVNLTEYDLAETKPFNSRGPTKRANYQVLLFVPTISFTFDELTSLSEGQIKIIDAPLYNGVVYLYKGGLEGVTFVEVTGTQSRDNHERLDNLYAVKREGNWVVVDQGRFFALFMDVAGIRAGYQGRPRAEVEKIAQITLEAFKGWVMVQDFNIQVLTGSNTVPMGGGRRGNEDSTPPTHGSRRSGRKMVTRPSTTSGSSTSGGGSEDEEKKKKGGFFTGAIMPTIIIWALVAV